MVLGIQTNLSKKNLNSKINCIKERYQKSMETPLRVPLKTKGIVNQA